jgi:hypothetical protein
MIAWFYPSRIKQEAKEKVAEEGAGMENDKHAHHGMEPDMESESGSDHEIKKSGTKIKEAAGYFYRISALFLMEWCWHGMLLRVSSLPLWLLFVRSVIL